MTHTPDPHEAYGDVPPNATLAYPTYEQLAAQQQHQYQEFTPLEHKPPRGNLLYVGMGVAGGLLLIAALGATYLLFSGGGSGDSDSSASAGEVVVTTTTSPGVPRTTMRTPPPGGLFPPPTSGQGLNLGMTVGKITSNDGTTLTISGLLGGVDTVRTNAQTQVMGASGGSDKVSDLKIGETVLVQGDRAADGSLTAKVIIATPLSGFGN